MPDIQRPVYFSMADRQLEYFLRADPCAFDRSLIWNLLFHDRILIPDIFLFISGGLKQHVLPSNSVTLFEEGIKRGLIIPCFRDASSKSFGDALGKIKEQRIQGLRDKPDEVARRLDRSRSSDFAPSYWPLHDVSQKFEERAVTYLQQDAPPLADQWQSEWPLDAVTIWEKTRELRFDVLNEARNVPHSEPTVGLRRGDFMNAIGQYARCPKGTIINDFEQILTLKHLSPDEQMLLNVFSKWVTEIYQYNQAVEFGTMPDFAGCDPYSLMVIEGLSATQTSASIPSAAPNLTSGIGTLQVDALLPPFEKLALMNPKTMLDVREHGQDYWLALEEWRAKPTEENSNKVRDTLRTYCRAITNKCRNELVVDPQPIEGIFGSMDPDSRKVLALFLAVPLAGVESLLTWNLPYVTMSLGGYAAFRWLTMPTMHRVELPPYSVARAELLVPNPKDGQHGITEN
jgi:hypothetical protein